MNSNLTALITGANSGIGKVMALELAKAGLQVIMVCRNPEKGRKALEEIKSAAGNPQVELFICDLASQKQVRNLAAELRTRYKKIDRVINNAGAIFVKRTVTEDGIENTFATNHLAYFLLTNLMLDLLKAAPAARIINVASQAQQGGRIHWQDVNLTKGYSALRAYMQSKLANIMFTNELARRLQNTPITANAMHPGGVRSGFARNNGRFAEWVLKLISPLMRSPEKGAETGVWLALSDEVKGQTGKYYYDKKPIAAQPMVQDPLALERLWNLSASLVGLGASS